MKSNKILVLQNCFFNLPDDFNGSWRDAVQLYAEYVKNDKDNIKVVKESETFKAAFDILWNDNERKHISKINVQELIDGKWVNK